MKNIILALAFSGAFLLGACTTNIAVETSSKVATYDEMSGKLVGDMDATLVMAFKATNLALEKDLKYFRTGQVQGSDSWVVYARAQLDEEISVIIKQTTPESVQIKVSYDGGNLMKSQEIFNAIARNVRALSRR